MSKRLNEKQIAAIVILAQPRRADKTYEEIAKEVGVAKSTLFEWKKLDEFNKALKDEIVRNTLDRLPEVMASIPDHIISSGNAAMFRTMLQMHGLLTDKLEVESKGSDTVDIDAIKARLAQVRSNRSEREDSNEK